MCNVDVNVVEVRVSTWSENVVNVGVVGMLGEDVVAELVGGMECVMK